MSRQPITTPEQLLALDDADIHEGYRAGRDGDPEPGNNRSDGFWHGWRNGTNDRLGVSDEMQQQLVRACMKAWGRDPTKWPMAPKGGMQ